MASRRNIQSEAVDLSMLVGVYALKKKELSPIEKIIKDYAGKIKAEFKSRGITEFESDGVRASITTTPNEDFNEEQAIEILREALTPEQFSSVVKQKEYIDDDAFEKLTYEKEVDPSILQPCRTAKEPTVTLRLGKAKTEEEN